MNRGLSLVIAVTIWGCGAPAIMDASRRVADMRGCEAAQLTMGEAEGAGDGVAYDVSGCGEPQRYACQGDTCSAADGAVNSDWMEGAMSAMAAIEADVLECNGGEAVTVQVRIDTAGRVDALAAHPELGSDERLCIGRVVYDNVSFDATDSIRLVAYPFGEGGAAEPDSLAVEPEPALDEGVSTDPAEETPDESASGPADDGTGSLDVEDEEIE